jgi:hypothetical protein
MSNLSLMLKITALLCVLMTALIYLPVFRPLQVAGDGSTLLVLSFLLLWVASIQAILLLYKPYRNCVFKSGIQYSLVSSFACVWGYSLYYWGVLVGLYVYGI